MWGIWGIYFGPSIQVLGRVPNISWGWNHIPHIPTSPSTFNFSELGKGMYVCHIPLLARHPLSLRMRRRALTIYTIDPAPIGPERCSIGRSALRQERSFALMIHYRSCSSIAVLSSTDQAVLIFLSSNS